MGRGRDFDSGSRGGDQYDPSRKGRGFQARPPRAPLEWQQVHNLIHGSLEARISKAINENNEAMYSFTLGRAPFRDKPGSKNIQLRDIGDLAGIGPAIEAWIENDRDAAAA